MKINWKLRLKSYPFWVAVFGFIGFIVADSGVLEIGKYEMYVEAVMAILIAGGVISDPTTDGYADSNRALRYDEPRKDLN
jgi:phi LC3 family holin